MLKIGEFSKMSHITVKALRYYEKEGLLIPDKIDIETGYRFYETSQFETATKIKAYRQLGFSIEEIKAVLSSSSVDEMLKAKKEELIQERDSIDNRLSIIDQILEGKNMNYQVVIKTIKPCLVYYSEATLNTYSDIMTWIPSLGEECLKLNPNLKCAKPEYEFLEYLDCEFKENDIRVRHNEAVTTRGKENDLIKFREIEETKVVSILHKGPYEKLPEAYRFALDYVEKNGYKVAGFFRESYIDGIWNKEDPNEWLTEVQIPIK